MREAQCWEMRGQGGMIEPTLRTDGTGIPIIRDLSLIHGGDGENMRLL